MLSFLLLHRTPIDNHGKNMLGVIFLFVNTFNISEEVVFPFVEACNNLHSPLRGAPMPTAVMYQVFVWCLHG